MGDEDFLFPLGKGCSIDKAAVSDVNWQFILKT